MVNLRGTLFVIVLAAAMTTCAAKSQKISTSGAHSPHRSGGRPVQAKIVLKRDPKDATKCVSRTYPKKIEVDFDEDDGLIFVVRQQRGANCLPTGVELELRWTTANPTACPNLGTALSGSKTRFECDLGTYLPNTTYTFKVFRKSASLPGGEEMVEDPDVEIIQF